MSQFLDRRSTDFERLDSYGEGDSSASLLSFKLLDNFLLDFKHFGTTWTNVFECN